MVPAKSKETNLKPRIVSAKTDKVIISAEGVREVIISADERL
jgi:hypothetical protein